MQAETGLEYQCMTFKKWEECEKLRLEDKDGKNPEMQEIWGLQRLWGHPLGRNTSVGNQNIYNGT